MPPYSVIISWCNRQELGETLAANAALFEHHGVEVLVANCGGDPNRAARLMDGIPITRLRHLWLPDIPFNKSLAHNIAVFRSSGQDLFFLDTDVVLRSDVFSEAAPLLEREDCFVQVRTVHETQPRVDARLAFIKEIITTQEFVLLDGRRVCLQSFAGGTGSRYGAGLMFVKRQHLMAVGGFNSVLKGWGYEDFDLQFRLQLALGLTTRAAGTALHLTHGHDQRGLKFGSAEDDRQYNMTIGLENYRQERYLGSYDADVRAWGDRVREWPRPSAGEAAADQSSTGRVLGR